MINNTRVRHNQEQPDVKIQQQQLEQALEFTPSDGHMCDSLSTHHQLQQQQQQHIELRQPFTSVMKFWLQARIQEADVSVATR
jgi:hypothetical protein